jgi:hypothetical protein
MNIIPKSCYSPTRLHGVMSQKPTRWIYAEKTETIYVRLSIYLSICGFTAFVGLGSFFSFLIHTQSVGLFGRGISPSQGRYLYTEQHKHRTDAHTDIHTSSVIKTHDPSVRASEDSSCLGPRGHCDLSDYGGYNREEHTVNFHLHRNLKSYECHVETFWTLLRTCPI